MSTIGDLRASLATALATVVGSVAANRNVSIDKLPAAVISIDAYRPAGQGNGGYDADVTVDILVSAAELPKGWEQVDDLVSGNTIATALRAICDVVSYTSIGDEIAHDGQRFIGFQASLRVVR